jgi:chemotaxis protein histidine kinase CheA
MLSATLLASIATIAIVASANAQLQPGPNISPSGRSFVYSPRASLPYGSTGNGCMGFGKQWVAMVNQIADGMNVEGSTNFYNITVARNQIDPLVEAKFHEVRQELYRQHQQAERVRYSVPFALPPDWDVPLGNLGAALRRLDDPNYTKCFPRVAKLVKDTIARIEARAQAEHQARLAAQEQAAEEAKQQAEINRKRAAEQAVIELAKQETLAEEARKLAEITKKRAEEEAVVEAKRQQADAETRKAQAELARIAAQENARRQQAEADARAAIAQEVAREEAKPENKLQRAYRAYGLVQYCNKVRQGYLVTYINDEEMDRAQIMIKATERMYVRQGFADTSLTADSIWKRAMSQIGGQPIDSQSCKGYYHQLSDFSPVPSIQIEKP